jgi:hypothetical protein
VNNQTVKRRAPVVHYVLAIAFGTILTIAVSLVVAASNASDFWLAAGIGALSAAYPSVSLGAWIFVSNHTVTRDSRGEESVELTWMKQAASGAFLDVLIATLVVTVVLLIGRFDVDALPVLLTLIGLSAVDAGLRYLVSRYRALR